MAKPRLNYKNEREAYYKRVVEPAKVAADLALCELEKNIRDLLIVWPVGGMKKYREYRPDAVIELLKFITGKDRYYLGFEDSPECCFYGMNMLNAIAPWTEIKMHRFNESAERACYYLDDVRSIQDALYPEKAEESAPAKPELTTCPGAQVPP
jgi:hypothetical protein